MVILLREGNCADEFIQAGLETGRCSQVLDCLSRTSLSLFLYTTTLHIFEELPQTAANSFTETDDTKDKRITDQTTPPGGILLCGGRPTAQHNMKPSILV
jgi:hypothetical protein